MKKSVYIHIPFCHNICHYCDFNKFLMDKQPIMAYLAALNNEFALYGEIEAKSIYVGGGTPSALNLLELKYLLEAIKGSIVISPNSEYTVEINPEDLTMEKLSLFKEFGVNRLSIGVQTFNDYHLVKLGRQHTGDDVKRGIVTAQELGFDNISIDLIYALPGQTLSDVHDDIRQACSLNIQHVSAYSLIIEPKTVFYNLRKCQQLILPPDEETAQMMEDIKALLEQNNLTQYEISNYAKTGYESKHNLTYWNCEEYYGFGAGAHGYLNGIRYVNKRVLTKYMLALNNMKKPLLEENKLSIAEKMAEYIILGLRKVEGISLLAFAEIFACSLLEVFAKEVAKCQELALLCHHNDRLYLSAKGRMLGNEVFAMFI